MPTDEGIVGASEHHAVDLARVRAHTALEHLPQVGGVEVPELDARREPRAGNGNDLALPSPGPHELVILLQTQRHLGRHHEYRAVRQGARGGLERRLDSHDGNVGMGGAQRRRRHGRRGVAGNHDRLGALRDEALGDVAREVEYLGLGLLAIGGVRGVAEEEEVLVRELGDERAQHADAADAGVEDPHEAVMPHLPRSRPSQRGYRIAPRAAHPQNSVTHSYISQMVYRHT